MLAGQGQSYGAGFDATARTFRPQGTIFTPTKVYLKDGVFPSPVMLREMPTIMIETQFVDSRERPTRGSFVWLWGQFPPPANPTAVQEAVFEGDGLSATINGPEREDKNAQQLCWSTQLMADAMGRLTFASPEAFKTFNFCPSPRTRRSRSGTGWARASPWASGAGPTSRI